MRRLTRQESQQLTKQNLIETAVKEILRIGIYEASIRQICDAAGYTLGAFYSNFKDKDELLLEVVEVHTKRQFDLLKKLVKVASTQDEDAVLDNIGKWLHNLQKDEVLTGLNIEFEIYAKHNESFKLKYSDHKNRWHNELATVLETIFESQKVTPKIPVSQMALGMHALWIGFTIDTSISNTYTADIIIPVFLKALIESSK